MIENADIDSLMNDDLFDGSEEVRTDVAVEDVTVTEETSESVAEASEATVTVSAQTYVRRTAGRKPDLNGSTALGAARILAAANTHLSSTALSKLLVDELGAKFGTKKQVAHTYASTIRSEFKKKGITFG